MQPHVISICQLHNLLGHSIFHLGHISSDRFYEDCRTDICPSILTQTGKKTTSYYSKTKSNRIAAMARFSLRWVLAWAHIAEISQRIKRKVSRFFQLMARVVPFIYLLFCVTRKKYFHPRASTGAYLTYLLNIKQ